MPVKNRGLLARTSSCTMKRENRNWHSQAEAAIITLTAEANKATLAEKGCRRRLSQPATQPTTSRRYTSRECARPGAATEDLRLVLTVEDTFRLRQFWSFPVCLVR